MFGGSPGYYEVTWDVYKRKDFHRLSFPVSFILGEPNLCIKGIILFITLIFGRFIVITLNIGFLDKEWELLDITDCNSHWTSKAANNYYDIV